jgi:hypothetical protein
VLKLVGDIKNTNKIQPINTQEVEVEAESNTKKLDVEVAERLLLSTVLTTIER